MLERIKPLPLYLLLIATLGPAAVEKIAGAFQLFAYAILTRLAGNAL